MFKLNILGMVIASCLALVPVASAAGLANPMRPPAGFNAPKVRESQPLKARDPWHLQSVILGKTRAVALIDGVPVAAGEWFQGARLIKVKPTEVVLRGAKGDSIVLNLTPEVHKQQLSADTEIIQQ